MQALGSLERLQIGKPSKTQAVAYLEGKKISGDSRDKFEERWVKFMYKKLIILLNSSFESCIF